MKDLKFPIGPCIVPNPITESDRHRSINDLDELPTRLRDAVAGLSQEQLDTPYRPGGWTVRQVIHHVPDSHLHAYTRCKFAMAEENPTIKPYDEKRWSEFSDAQVLPIDVSLAFLTALHERWTTFLRSLTSAQLLRTFHHPEYDHLLTIEETMGRYAWHGRHHTAHITELRARQGW